jgi:hypothetical protein
MMIRLSYSARRARTTFVLAALALISTTAATAQQEIQPLTPDGTYYGMRLADWAVAWFQWRYSLPKSSDPDVVVDENGEWAGIGQRTPVWFLPVFQVGTATRTFTVPEGQAILAVAGWTQFHAAPGTYTDNELLARVNTAFLNQVSPTVRLDGVPITGLKRYRVLTPVFSSTLPPENHLGIPVTPGEDARVAMAGAGHFLLFPPLLAGKHVYTVKDAPFGVDYTINLIVQKPNEPVR